MRRRRPQPLRPDFRSSPGWMTQDIIWDWLSRFAAGQYVDAEAGTCDFLSEDYITLLERCAATSTEFGTDYDALYNGFLQFEPLQNLVRLAVVSGNYGGAYTFAGAPNETTNGSMYSPGLSLAISAQSEHAETAAVCAQRAERGEPARRKFSLP